MNSSGFTPSEKYLVKVCKKSFLSLWMFSNPFNDRGKINNQKQGKELCDVLIVSGKNIIIFSDKHCVFKSTGDLTVDWNRWYKKAVIKSIKQIRGAEGWIKKYPNRVFLDKNCEVPISTPLPSIDEMRIYRIAVASGAEEACIKHYGGGIGSLRISTIDNPIMGSSEESLKAFSLSFLPCNEGYVHVLGRPILDIIMKELDTIEDFIQYLEKKEQLIETTKLECTGEEELLARYLTMLDADGRHGFGLGLNVDLLHVNEGFYRYIENNECYKRKTENNKISYLWDELIEVFTCSYKRNEELTIQQKKDGERALRAMANLGRFERRVMSKKYLGHIKKSFSEVPMFRTCLPSSKVETCFIFCIGLSHTPNYHLVLRELTFKKMQVCKLQYENLKEVVGIITGCSLEDKTIPQLHELLYINSWDTEKELNKIYKELKLDQWQRQITHSTEYEYT